MYEVEAHRRVKEELYHNICEVESGIRAKGRLYYKYLK
jgi:hypothetical protein